MSTLQRTRNVGTDGVPRDTREGEARAREVAPHWQFTGPAEHRSVVQIGARSNAQAAGLPGASAGSRRLGDACWRYGTWQNDTVIKRCTAPSCAQSLLRHCLI